MMNLKHWIYTVVLFIVIDCAVGAPIGTIYGSEIGPPPNNNPAIMTITGKDPESWQIDVTFDLLANRIVDQKIQDLRIGADPGKLLEQKLKFASTITTESLVQARETVTSRIAISKLYRQRFKGKAPSAAEKAGFIQEMSKTSDFAGLNESKLDSIIQQLDNSGDDGEKMISSIPSNTEEAQKQLFNVLEYGEKEKAFFDLVTSGTVVSQPELEKVKTRFAKDPTLSPFLNFPDILKAKALEKKKEVVYNQYILTTIDKDLKIIDATKFAEFRKRWQKDLIDSWDCFYLRN